MFLCFSHTPCFAPNSGMTERLKGPDRHRQQKRSMYTRKPTLLHGTRQVEGGGEEGTRPGPSGAPANPGQGQKSRQQAHTCAIQRMALRYRSGTFFLQAVRYRYWYLFLRCGTVRYAVRNGPEANPNRHRKNVLPPKYRYRPYRQNPTTATDRHRSRAYFGLPGAMFRG